VDVIVILLVVVIIIISIITIIISIITIIIMIIISGTSTSGLWPPTSWQRVLWARRSLRFSPDSLPLR
jgi:hypothetical protein